MFLIIGILSFLGAGIVRWYMTQTYAKWREVPNGVQANGHAVARHILDSNGLQNVQLEVSKGELSDHYIPSQKRMRLSPSINNEPSIAAIAVAAHECGHALQDAAGYRPLELKAVLMPVAAIGNQGGLMMALAGGFLGSSFIVNTGMILICAGILMQLLTLPIEFDASKRALAELTRLNLVNENDYAGAKSMLFAAALTYVASAASSMAFLLFIVFNFIRR